ncbi:hypothetical protein GW17_00035064 [Ensete ventricosum]|nr:hypothetical protein GW17_00035064 [Ensete ventricosum]RZS13338.1 hypothetical protein BHM03_00044907 [Ensete ventricosum]
MLGNNLPQPRNVVSLYKSNNIVRMRIHGPNQAACKPSGTPTSKSCWISPDACRTRSRSRLRSTWASSARPTLPLLASSCRTGSSVIRTCSTPSSTRSTRRWREWEGRRWRRWCSGWPLAAGAEASTSNA